MIYVIKRLNFNTNKMADKEQSDPLRALTIKNVNHGITAAS